MNARDLPSDGLLIAEEIIDRRTVTEVFQGRELDSSTGRVLLHAVRGGDQALCGAGPAGAWEAGAGASGADRELTYIGQRWDARYLPHVPRCRGCARAAGATGGTPRPGADLDGQPGDPPTGPSAGVDVRAAHGTEQELDGAAALRAVLTEFDLRRWMFTDLVLVDDEIRGGFSHPLTINPVLLVSRPAGALATFLHEQLHWVEGPGVDAATTEARQRWPEPPPPPAGGHDAESTWLHLSVCALEYQSLCELLGPEAAAGELRQQKHYSWMYEQILTDPGWFAAFLDRHGITVPAEPPVPRRYCGEDWWTSLM
jgi:hypothetical protein